MAINVPGVLALRVSHLENVILKSNIEFIDSEAPDYKKINTLFNHIFRDIKKNTYFTQEQLENIECALDEAHVYFLLNVKQGVIDKIAEAKQMIYDIIAPTNIIANRLLNTSACSSDNIGDLNALPDLVKFKIGSTLAQQLAI